MTAPSLLLLGFGGDDPRSTEVAQQIRTGISALRPELDAQVAFADHTPSVPQVINKLVRRRVGEVVLMPLVLGDQGPVRDQTAQVMATVRAAHPELQVIAARPIGPEPQLLGVVDRRLRDALRARRVCELDGLVFASAGSGDVRANALVARRARQWSNHHKLPCLTAFSHDGGPSTAEAIRTLRSQGRRHIAVGSWFLSHDAAYTRQSDLAFEHGAVAVSQPLGGEPEIVEAVLTRYVVAAMDLVDLEPVLDAEPAPVRHLSVVGA